MTTKLLKMWARLRYTAVGTTRCLRGAILASALAVADAALRRNCTMFMTRRTRGRSVSTVTRFSDPSNAFTSASMGRFSSMAAACCARAASEGLLPARCASRTASEASSRAAWAADLRSRSSSGKESGGMAHAALR